jgi:tape measure domain-containing protein
MSFNVKFIYDLVDKLSPALKVINKNIEANSQAVARLGKSLNNNMNNLSLDKFNRTKNVVLRNFSRATSDMIDNMSNMSDKAFNFSQSVAIMSTGLGAMGIKAIKSSANFETLAIQLEVLTGSAEKGKKLFDELAQFADKTPFELPEIVQATRTLLGSNIALKDVVDTTKMLGDVSAGSGADIKSLAVIYGQVAGMTKLQGQDAMQFISNGIPIWALLQKTTGKSISQLRQLGTDGKISFDLVNKALTQATQKGGMYYKATEKLSESVNGLFSTLGDSINKAFGKLGDEIIQVIDLKNLVKDITVFAGKITDAFSSLSPEMKTLIVYGGLFLTALLPIGLALGGFFVALKQILIVFEALLFLLRLNPLTLWLSAITLLIYNFDKVLEVVKKIFDYVGKIITGAKNMFGGKVILGQFGNAGLEPSQQAIQQPINQNPYQYFSGGLNVNFNNAPKNTSITKQSSPNFELGTNMTYAR